MPWLNGNPENLDSPAIRECESVTSLYQLSLESIATNIDVNSFTYDLLCLPVKLKFDLYQKMFDKKLWKLLYGELNQLDNFSTILMHSRGHRHKLHMFIQRLMDESFQVTSNLSQSFVDYAHFLSNQCTTLASKKEDTSKRSKSNNKVQDVIRLGYTLAGFLMEAGWYLDAEKILTSCLDLYHHSHQACQESAEESIFLVKVRLLGALTSYSRFKEAMSLYESLEEEIVSQKLESKRERFDVCQAYNQFAVLFNAQSLYKEAYKWSCLALANFTQWTPRLTLIDIFRTTGLSCIIKKDFESADYLLKQALLVCKELFDLQEKDECYDVSRFHPKFGDLLTALGYYYHNIDIPVQSVKLYTMALDFRKRYFGPFTPIERCINIPLALAHQDLAFEYYVQEYSTGRFELSQHNIELAKMFLETLLPPDHHLLSGVKRTKALILEEIAIDHHDPLVKTELLTEAHKLHLSALEITKKLLGEENVQTAKHYAHLGRLYQSMQRYEDSEMMQLRAIEIKERCLGKDDYEVAQSFGYLASLYGYDLEMYEVAERYYLKAIEIGTKVFGKAYSGLEFEYQGLLRVYSRMNDVGKQEQFLKLLRSWKLRRDAISSANIEIDPFASLHEDTKLDLEKIKQHFFTNRLHQF